jgi:sec-independent protein translocase protein TatB
MFGLSFSEIIVISIVALLVLGPERIPVVARTVGRTLAELRRSVDSLKQDLSLNDFAKDIQTLRQLPRLPSELGLRTEPIEIVTPLPQMPESSTSPNGDSEINLAQEQGHTETPSGEEFHSKEERGGEEQKLTDKQKLPCELKLPREQKLPSEQDQSEEQKLKV